MKYQFHLTSEKTRNKKSQTEVSYWCFPTVLYSLCSVLRVILVDDSRMLTGISGYLISVKRSPNSAVARARTIVRNVTLNNKLIANDKIPNIFKDNQKQWKIALRISLS